MQAFDKVAADSLLLSTPIAKLVQQIPGATAVFDRYQLSFCCGGHFPLREALDKAAAPSDKVVAELKQLLNQQQLESDWYHASDEQLISHILDRYHQVHRQQTVELIRLAEKVESVHGSHPQCPVGLSAHLKQMKIELEQHMEKEEGILFPMLRRGMGQQMSGPINVMLNDHDDHEQALQQLKELAHDFHYPTGACNTWRALYLGLIAFVSDLEQHIRLENNILFARQLSARAG